MSQSGGAPLTDRQRAVLSAIIDYHRVMKRIPKLRELAQWQGVHHSTAQQHISELHRKKWLRAPVPGLPTRALPPLPSLPALPIPPRDEDDAKDEESGATIERRTLTSPALSEPAKVELRTLPGESRPSTVIVRTRTRTRWMDLVRDGGPDGPITGFKITEEVEG